ncbi:hypothetical protein EVAR_89488_1 [Eumeta japonica]|uniref:Uncharacterized protein n=1 Tax=Eumeta variegata TaxID=151549 RepID=A0A4C1XGZ8_EUMVA|nr:hypothetical protein EVAR_89488_1 [Eumeta japonica]
MGHRDEMQQWLLLHVCIVCECGVSAVELVHFRAAVKLTTAWLYHGRTVAKGIEGSAGAHAGAAAGPESRTTN